MTPQPGEGVAEADGAYNKYEMFMKEALSKPLVRVSALLIAVVIVLAMGGVTLVTEHSEMETRNWVAHSYEVHSHLSRLEVAGAEARNSVLSDFLRNDDSSAPQVKEQVEVMRQSVATIRALVQDDPRQLVRVEQLAPLVEQQATQLRQYGPEAVGGTSSATRNAFLVGVQDRQSQIRTIIAAMEQEEQGLLNGRLRIWSTLFRRNLIATSVAFAIALGLLFRSFGLWNAKVANRKEMEKLALEKTESRRALSAHILESQDVERRRIARELHDSVGQYLAGLKMSLRQLSPGRLSYSSQPAWLSETMDMTDRAIGEIRTISHLLHPPLLDELGFESTAKRYVKEFAKRSGIKVRLEIGKIANRLPKGSELALFRVLQESLTNVHRHARARAVGVRLLCTERGAILEVQDDGKGIPQRVLRQFESGGAAGIGLAGMRERLVELGGALTIESSPKGARVRATLPTTLGEAEDGKAAPALGASVWVRLLGGAAGSRIKPPWQQTGYGKEQASPDAT